MKKYIIFLLIAAPFVLNAQMTYIPDDNFEQALINLGLDSGPLNDSVPTKIIDTLNRLDVSSQSIFNLTGIEDFIGLESLSCPSNRITSLDVSKHLSLKYLDCSNNRLTSLELSKNTALRVLYCSLNSITKLDLSFNSSLYTLDCGKNQLTSLDVSKNPALERLECEENYIKILDVRKKPSLRILYCWKNQLKSLDISDNSVLRELYCDVNQLTSLDVSKNLDLGGLYCSSNKLTSLNVKNGNNLKMTNDSEITFYATNNPNLICIQVDDSAWSSNNPYWYKDSTAHYSTDCGYTGVDELKIGNNSVSVSPNPAMDYIEISFPPSKKRGSGGVSMVIYDMLGKEVLKGMDSRFRGNDSHFPEGISVHIDVSHLAPGIYFVRIGDVVRKFVKI